MDVWGGLRGGAKSQLHAQCDGHSDPIVQRHQHGVCNQHGVIQRQPKLHGHHQRNGDDIAVAQPQRQWQRHRNRVTILHDNHQRYQQRQRQRLKQRQPCQHDLTHTDCD
jgi:hypothetical protein